MEHLSQDAVRTFFALRLAQLEGFETSDLTEPEILEACAWLEDESRSMFAWIEQGPETKRLVQAVLSRSATESVEDRLPAPIRTGAVKEFCYFFKREDDQPITSSNLNEQVLFGCSRGPLLESLLSQMNNIYVPVALADHGWPDNVRKEFTSQVQSFMLTVTAMTHQGKGSTVLYIPQENFANLEAASKDKDIVQRLKVALIHWHRQIKEVTTQQDSANEGESNGPLDEIEFWNARDKNLSRLHEQLESTKLQEILTVLEHAKSGWLKKFRALEEDIKNGSIEAKENLRFLNFLKEPCEKLAVATPPEIPAILPELLNYVRMIWSISTHYQKEDRISGLLRKMSNEIIKRCQATIDLADIFSGRVETSMVKLQQCIDCGREWKRAYQKTVRLLSKNTDRPWTFPEGSIFLQIDAFVQRCCDLLEVCQGLQQFACRFRGQAMPAFGGTKAGEISSSLNEIEENFLKNLQRLQPPYVDYDILDVRAPKWPDHFGAFKEQMRDLEVMYMNVVNSAFEGVGTVQTACQVLDSFYQLAQRERVKTFVEKKGESLYLIFLNELNHNIKKEFDQFRKLPTLPIIQGHPMFAGPALAVRGLMLRIQLQMAELDQLCYLECREQENCRDVFNTLHGNMETFVLTNFQDWTQELKSMDDQNLGKRLQVNLLVKPEETMSKFKGGLLECNFEKDLLKMFQEVYYWEKIQGSGIVVPYAAHELGGHRDKLRVLREHVLRVVRDYNQIMSALMPEERRLFNHHIRTLDRKIGPGLTKFTWTSDGIKEFFVRDSCKECAKVYDWVKQFKRNNTEILQVCKKLSELHMIKIEKKTVHRDDEFRDVQERRREEVKAEFNKSLHKITELMLSSYTFFETHPPDIQREWKLYIDKVDKSIKESLKKAVKTSLQDLCKALNGDTKTEPSPLFKIQAVLDEVKMDFKPPMSQLKDLLQMVCRDMTMTLSVVPRLAEHLYAVKTERDRKKKEQLEEAGDLAGANAIPPPGDPPKKKKGFFEEISKDEDCCIKYVKEVLRGFNHCAMRLGERLKYWNSSYQPIVSQDKDTFIRRYKKTERSLTIVGQDIQRYKDVQTDIQQDDPKVVIDFIETDFQPLKSALVDHCQQWQKKLTDLLNENARTEMNRLLEYFDTNTKTFHSEIQDMDELKNRISLLEQCRKDDADMENKIKPIEDKYAKLTEFEVIPSDEELQQKAQMRPRMETFRETLVEAEIRISKSKKQMKAGLEQDLGSFGQSIRDVKTDFSRHAPYKSDGLVPEMAFQMLQNYRNQIEQKRKLEAEFRPKQELFGLEPANYKELEWVEQEIEKLSMVWEIRDGWNKEWDKLRSGSFQSLNTDDMDELAMQFLAKLRKVIGKDKNVQNWQVYQDLKSDLETFRNMMPVITHLRSDAMRERHIEAIVKEVKESFNPKDAKFTLQRVMDLGLQKHADLIARLCDDAKKEAKIENGLEDIARIWSTMTIDVVEHKGDAFKVRSTEELYQALDENIQALSSYKSSPFYLPFAPKVEYWEKTLAHISEVTESIQSVQKSWMYLENVFRGSEDIRPHLPDESIMFDDVNEGFINMMRKVYQEPLATKACCQPKMLENLQSFEASLENIQKKLNDYLEKKRQFFPRFYFISNDDLLEILGQARDPEQVQKHIKKCFEGVKSLELQPPAQNRRWEAVGLNAPDGEREKMVAPVKLEGPVEVWLGLVEKRMFESLKAHLVKCHNMNINPKAMKKEKWVKEFLGQLLITSGQIAWTTDCAAALAKVEKGQKNALRMLKRTQSKYISKLCEMIRKPLTKIERNKLVALITIEVHARDVQDRMINLKTESPSNFNWTSQLRFELRESQEETAGQPVQICVVLQTNTTGPYGYEYQGNNGRLVVTPMTDRCYMTLTTAMHLKRGGAPAGPAGTGKTESVKDLGKGMAMYVIVFNCSDGLDYKSLGRMFSGLAQCGCWGCFDEFNRIDVSVLSVVAVQIMTIQAALKEEKEKFLFEDILISLKKTCAVFITMNPGYAGRSELPDNLKALFRPVAMMVPDLAMIMEIMLVSEGFKDFKMLAKKKFTLYQMMLQQMSKQHHYDFGLRNIKSVLGCAGALKRKEPDMPEQILLMRAINDMNAPKWVSQDVPLYQALLSDIFPGVELPVPDYGKLEEVINQVLEEMGCQKVKHSVAKCISIYETKITRHGNMLVGGTLGGKSVCWKTLAKAKCILKSMGQEGMEKVAYDIINPKSITMNELYGAYDAATMMEWTDGVLSSIMRRMCQDEKPDEKWLVLDGPVDTLWIESMNTVLDDNKVLTLINGDRISMPPMVRLLFEVSDLAQASPATVSRAGMVYFDPPDLGWEPYFKSWVEKFIPANRQADVLTLSEKWIPKCLKIRKTCVELAPIVDTNAVMSLTRLYETLAPKIDIEAFGDKAMEALDKLFAFSLIWSLGASITEASRATFDQCVREVENYFPSQSIYDYAFNFEKAEFAPWDEKLPNPFKPSEGTPFHKIVVPTTDTTRNMFILKQLNSKHFHSLLVGSTGTGKTIAVQEAIAGLEEATWTSLTINMSAMTSSGKTQEIIESKIEKRIKNKFGPAGNKRMLMFVDDLNMPRKDTFGSQPPLELLRQWIDYGCWYDRQKQTLRYAEGIHMVAAMGPPGGGRAVISARLQSAANNLCFVNPADSQIKRIFMTLASNKLNNFASDEIKALSEPLTMTTINIYTQVIDGFLPTPEKCHYLFNLRDIAKIFQGIYLADPKVHEQKEQIVRMWYHEGCRVFMDRLINNEDRDKFRNLLDTAMDNGLQVRQKEIDGGDPDFVFAALDLGNAEAEDAVYDYMQDRNSDAGLKKFMEQRNEDYNAMFKKSPMSLVMFKEAVEICCKVLRILKQPQGNALLIGVGGSGRHCQTRLASFIAFYKCFSIEITKQYKHGAFLEDLKKLYELTGVKNQKLTFLFSDTEIVEESFLEDVANMLSSGEVPNLFTGDELSAIRANLEKAGKENKIAQTPEAMYDFFISRVRENLHIVFCMSYIGNNFRDYCRMYPSLVSCTTAIWLLPWPAEALTEVALKFLTEGELEEHLRAPVAEIFGAAHTTVMRFSTRIYQEQKRMNYVTPTNYLELVQGYMKMLKDKQKELGAAADKLRNGLSKLDDARVQVAEMSVDLEEKQKICDVKAKECEELLKVITAERSKADAQQAQVEADSIRIEKEAKETKILADDATRDLEKAMPALDAAVDALEKLDKKSIAEVKAYAKPPEAVMKTMCAVMTVMEKTPSWGQAKTELNDTNFLVRIKTFDKDNIKDTTLRKIEKFTKDSNFTPKLVSNVSLAAGALCQWVHAMKIYAEIYREVEPKRNKLRQAQEKLESKQKQLREANAELKKVQDLVKNLNDQFTSSNNEKETLARTAEELKVKLERAGKLVDGLAGEKVRWTESLGRFDIQQENLFGDCLVSAAFMSYAGPFGAAFRNELVNDEWMASVKEKEVPFTSSYTFSNFLAKQTEVREWNLQKLPADDFSTENGVLVTKSRRFPLMIDPQSQANAWVRKMEESRQLKVFDPNSKDIMKSLERAIEFGSPVLLENVGEELDPSLEPILAKNIIDNGGGTLSLKVGDNVLDYNPAFMFYITTKLSNPHYTPEVSTKTTIVNFIVVLDGLTNQLLGVIVRCEDQRLEEDKNRLLIQVAKGRNRLVELENEILRLLAETKGSLLDDLSLIDTLQESKVISIQTTEQVAHAEQNMIKIDGQRENYRPAGLRSAVLYFVLNDLVAIDPMYQFALAAYELLYIGSIEKSAEKKISVGGVEERIEDLNAYHALAVYKYGCRAIFERHKLLLSLHLCAQVLKYSNDLNETEFSFFLFGGQVFDRTGQAANPSSDWINQSMWDNIVEADAKLESFKGFQTSLEQSLRDWKKWYSASEPEKENLPGEWHERLDPLQKLIVVRCIRPDRVLPAVQVFVALKLDQKFVEPPPLDLEAIYDETSCLTPLLFVLTPGMDPTGQLRALAISRNVPWQTISLGQGQEPKAIKMMTDGAEKGFWVLLANCHLCVHWLPDLEKLIEKTFDHGPHEKFRIFMSSSPTPKFPIQLLQNCIKMTTEPPKGLKANLVRLLQNTSEDSYNRVKEVQKYRRLFFSLCWFHAVLLERKKFKMLGWNIGYDFNDSDFDICENILAMYLDENPTEIPWDAIRYLIAEANYGGRVTEHPDNRVLRSYVTEFFCTAALQPKFPLSSLPTYYIPEDGSLHSYRQYVQSLPLSEPPEAFGQHNNAEISSSLADTDTLLQTMIEVRGGGGAAAGGDIGETVFATCNTLLEKLPDNLDWEEVRDRNEADSSPLKVCLLQEIERYNILLSSVRSSIKTLQKGIQGLVVISKEQEAVLNSLYAGSVPASWLFAYPSMKPLGSWMPDLADRIEQLNTWGFVGVPKVLWLGGLTYPTSLLTAVLQQSARKNMVSVDTLSFDFVVQNQDESQITSLPKEGAYIKSMILEGAKWDLNAGCLADADTMALFNPMPIVHFKPVVRKKVSTEGMYQCPLYLYPIRTGTRERPSFMIWVDLKAGNFTADQWTKRGTALLLSVAT